jgi:hypothetical protein
MKAINVFILLIIVAVLPAYSQPGKKFEIDGYFKLMQTTSFGEAVDGTQWDYLFHNRVNTRYNFNKKFTAALEFRNRIFAGEAVSNDPEFGALIDDDQGAINLSWLFLDSKNMVGLVQIDRAWVEYNSESWKVMAGRQRVNWGINLFWNNHDLFNTYSLVEFDYEERPGSDAVRVTKILGDEHWLEFAAKYPANDSDVVAALRYAFAMNRYDVKILGGIYNNDIVGGFGWEGNIKDAGFKGEVAYFYSTKDYEDDVLSISISTDYYFKNKLFVTLGYLFQDIELPVQSDDILVGSIANRASAKMLMPFDHNLIINFTYPITPLLNSSVMATWTPVVNASFLMGSLMYSLSDNWELSVFTQSFVWNDTSWNNPVNSIFLRIKNSF